MADQVKKATDAAADAAQDAAAQVSQAVEKAKDDGRITQADVEKILSKIEPQIKKLLGESNESVNKAFEGFRKAVDSIKSSDGTFNKHEVEEKVRKLMADLNENDMVKAIVPYVTKAAFGAAVGIAAHRVTEDRLMAFGMGLLHVTSTVLFEKGVFSKESVENLSKMSKEEFTKLLDQDGDNKITPNDFAVMFEKQFKAMKEERPSHDILVNVAIAAASFAAGFFFLYKYVKA